LNVYVLRLGSRPIELADQVCIVASGFALELFYSIEDCFDAIDGDQYQGLPRPR